MKNLKNVTYPKLLSYYKNKYPQVIGTMSNAIKWLN